MEVIVAEHAGFCFGVTKAVDTVYEQIAKKSDGENVGNIYTYGPIIHNETVVSDLEKKGVSVIDSIDDLKSLADRFEENRKNGSSDEDKAKGTIVIRSHGVTREVQELIEKTGLDVIDATCPFVKRIHKVVLEESNKGASIIVVGSANHPEVEGIVSYVNGKVFVIDGPESAAKFSENKETNYTVVAQTTFNKKKFQETVEIFKNNGYNINIVNTICNATDERQTEAEEIASRADAMIVIGGAHSSNSRKLYEICKEKCADTYFIQTLEDLHLNLTGNVKLIGITAGASTPKNIIEEVQNYVRTNF
ncbi:4-hydroxy-3-methylbut-2-enyl diphosphate reductase [Butyrivibrio sp. INlla14]|uniref:4-hydroxy-3-methylbut-2-enyl diphosphate reductase n=1 Tax=Butyrivibrio sp. INlla14 TaxID=1520808 RepID=UPI0008771546|nr:4-hydroxy-3-methylbut-2-enyl diphosphate reductase [Butyrivibrio sp. INlla14]SCY08276.1 4-hydroxy-3-methylbut-2-enyl diphosphate reductase [Butyrivibrio sp. INlla14]